MAGADDDYIELFGELHGKRERSRSCCNLAIYFNNLTKVVIRITC
jgi:hypothetical protein